jgi:uncharacterized protein YjbI with pentapeptide repeats
MANSEHLEFLKQGVEVWNRWRDENPDAIPELREANLSGMDLAGANLHRAELGEANLSRVNLSSANLHKAHLGLTYLGWANLNEANLSDAICTAANFSKTNLTRANFSGATIGYNIFGDVDLSTVRGLETTFHMGPSEIGVRFLLRSGSQLPKVFLRGTGIPETFINFLFALTTQPIQFYSYFISYSSKDNTFAEHLHADLQQKGVRCWFAPEDMKIGDKMRHRIDESIRIHDKLLLILSENSLSSVWVESEVEKAFEEERQRKQTVLFPVRLDEVVMETNQPWASEIRRTRHIGDFSRWKDHDAYQQAFERLLRDLKAEE